MPYRETNPTATPALINDAPRAHEDDSFGQRGVCPRLPVKVRSGFPLSARPLTIALTGQGLDAVRAGIYRRALPLATRDLVIGHPALGEWSGTSGGLVDGFVAANRMWVRRVPGGVARSTRTPEGQVAVVIGGGSGHYPAFGGLVGHGLASGAVMGNVFASASAAQVVSVAKAAEHGGGVLLTYDNCSSGGNLSTHGVTTNRLRRRSLHIPQWQPPRVNERMKVVCLTQ